MDFMFAHSHCLISQAPFSGKTLISQVPFSGGLFRREESTPVTYSFLSAFSQITPRRYLSLLSNHYNLHADKCHSHFPQLISTTLQASCTTDPLFKTFVYLGFSLTLFSCSPAIFFSCHPLQSLSPGPIYFRKSLRPRLRNCLFSLTARHLDPPWIWCFCLDVSRICWTMVKWTIQNSWSAPHSQTHFFCNNPRS